MQSRNHSTMQPTSTNVAAASELGYLRPGSAMCARSLRRAQSFALFFALSLWAWSVLGALRSPASGRAFTPPRNSAFTPPPFLAQAPQPNPNPPPGAQPPPPPPPPPPPAPPPTA